MTTKGYALVEAAKAYLGTPFQLGGHGRKAGLDCIGLLRVSLEDCGASVAAIPAYSIRQSDISAHLRLASQAGLRSFAGPPEPGDILLLRPGRAQFHLAIHAGRGRIIHAHAGLRQVVLGPLPGDWAIERCWRLD